MKFNVKFKLKTKGKTLILILLLILSVVGISNIKVKPSQINKADKEIEPSTAPVTKFKYDYENNFDYIGYYAQSVFYGELTGQNTEWSQNKDDDNRLQFHYVGWFEGGLFGGAPFDMDAGLYVQSAGEFKPQGDLSLGAYIDFKIDIDLTSSVAMDLDSILITLNIRSPNPILAKQLISIYDMSPQEGRFYIPAFDNYIFPDGKVQFELRGRAYGQVATFQQLGGISLRLSFDGLKVIQEIQPRERAVERRTLILVHGFNLLWANPEDPTTQSSWSTYFNSPEFIEAYDDIIVISYYTIFRAFRYSGGQLVAIDTFPPAFCTTDTSIADIAFILKEYIKLNFMNIEDNVDFICHSMGGLVVRWMIKFWYWDIQAFYGLLGRDFQIRNVCTIATPNHGVWYGWITNIIPILVQVDEMKPGGPFLLLLNIPIETPYAPLIKWYTYRSGVKNALGIRHDGVVEIISVPLLGATNRGWFNGLDHEALRHSDMIKTIVFNDLFEPPDIINDIFATGIPGKIIGIEDLILEPNSEVPGGKTLLSIILDPQDVGDIDPISMEVDINPIFPMLLKSGTEDTYEVELPLEDGDYSFLITADEYDGGTYQIYGNLRIVDDDAQAPQIFILPIQTFISDEEAEGGVSVLWEISDYSGIDEAIITLNDEEIATYTDESEISGDYTIPNSLGVYSFSFYARDDDNDPGHDPPEGDWLEESIIRTFVIYDDDNAPPLISITPGDMVISDEDAIGGIEVSWDITDYSGIMEATVELNGFEIASYGPTEALIHDSYNLPNEPGTYTFDIWAKDGDNDLRDPLEQDWLDNSLQRTIIIYDDDTTGPDLNYIIIDRYWVGDQLCLEFDVTAGDPESMVSSVDINIGTYHEDYSGRHYAVLDPGYYVLQLEATNADFDRPFDTESSFLSVPIDLKPLVTTISFNPPYLLLGDNYHITSDTEIIFSVDVAAELDSTYYKISNDLYRTKYSAPLYLNLDDGIYTLEYYSVDTDGNTEKTKSVSIVLDNSAPNINIITPSPGVALQDGVTFTMEVTDLTRVEWVTVSIREPGGPNGNVIDPAFEGLYATNVGGDIWQYEFDTTLLPDGFYILFVETIDPFSAYASKTVEFAIRNWCVLELLPSTETNRPGRTMPVKFALRVCDAVDPAMPFVWNEELDILIYSGTVLLQHSTFGDTSKDYRISAEGEHYITNFKTSKTPTIYTVEIWRKGMPIGTFEFQTERK